MEYGYGWLLSLFFYELNSRCLLYILIYVASNTVVSRSELSFMQKKNSRKRLNLKKKNLYAKKVLYK